LEESNTCAQIESGNVTMPEPNLPIVEELRYTSINNLESDMYFYHSHHLGSSSWITDASGAVNQHLQYLAFGEDYIYQRNSSWNVPYTFSGKEKDSETGYSYFGARYYDSDISVWLSVDPMSDKYPNQSAYSYVGWRPINVIDPNGEDEWEINECGEIVNHIINDKKDAIHIVNKDNVRIEGKSKEFEYGTLQSFSYRPNNNKKEITFFAALGDSKGGEIFQFLAENTNIEWSLTRTGDNVDGLNYIGTSNSEGSVVGNVFVMEYFGTNVREAIHNHPSDNNESSEGDINVASKYEGKFPNINFFNYTKSHGYTQYSSSTKPSLPEFKLAPGQVSANKPREIKALPPTLKMRNLKVDFKHIRN